MEPSNQTLYVILKDLKQDIGEIKVQTTKTNGKVRSLEIWRGYITGGIAILGAILIPILMKLSK